MTDTNAILRDELLRYLELNLLGPADGEDEVLKEPPHQRYLMGTLFPKESVADDEANELGSEELDFDDEDDPIQLATQWMPASAGLSFFVVGPCVEVRVEVAGAVYVEEKREYWRVPFAKTFDLVAPEGTGVHLESREVLVDHADLRIRWRPYAGGRGCLVTVTLVNSRTREVEGAVKSSDCLFQPSITVRSTQGLIRDYPRFELLLPDPADREIQLLYRRKKTFAVGHGCAVTWDDRGEGEWVSTTFFPRTEVKPLTTEVPGLDDQVLRWSYLASESTESEDLHDRLLAFVSAYETWVERLPEEHGDIPAHLATAREDILKRLRHACCRMREGVATLFGDPNMREAFRMANLAMTMQREHSKPAYAGERRRRGNALHTPPDYAATDAKWRPFQLAFMLLTLAGASDPVHRDREVVDLIWFPTGGGKTEAYLLVAAYVILLARLRNPSNAQGTVVITRYTLRLLTAQQFQRTAALICALEMMRSFSKERLGTAPITIGLWLGGDTTPNDFATAERVTKDLLEESEPKNVFQLERCPWCGTEIVPTEGSRELADYGLRASGGAFEMFCPSSGCAFHALLPVNVVDEALYAQPPTFLVATIDKFARFAWDERPGCFLGGGDHRVPSLIIQDELHLVAGPLGTVAGLYEAAFDEVIAMNGGKVKIVASTATIRNADEQVRGLFARKVEVFPPAGLVADDSFFARVDPLRHGRLYCGFMPPGHSSTTAQVNLMSLVAQQPMESEVAPEADDFWTQVVYHNSLREHGKTTTLLRDDVPARIDGIAVADSRHVDDDNIIELTSNTEEEMTDLLGRLAIRHVPGAQPDRSVSVVSCTNMLSVGVDVSRLAVMTIVGQPKATAEYIQASSRVGRSEVPGLVITLYRPLKPRDRSHYESFRSYHESLYRYVEPTSVTPFALPARQRALHAALVVLVRHATSLGANHAAHLFDPASVEIAAVIAALERRVRLVDPLEAEATIAHLRRLVANWHEQAKRGRSRLHYKTSTADGTSLLKQYDQTPDFDPTDPPWTTLDSMRNVDSETLIKVQGT